MKIQLFQSTNFGFDKNSSINFTNNKETTKILTNLIPDIQEKTSFFQKVRRLLEFRKKARETKSTIAKVQLRKKQKKMQNEIDEISAEIDKIKTLYNN